ncbi:MAG: hypothetical protein U0R78_16970 [Nocardioidaceae bacterium]
MSRPTKERIRRGAGWSVTRTLGVACAVATLVLVAPWIAHALTINDGLRPTGNYDPGDCSEGSPGAAEVCQTDNATVTYYMDSNGTYELEAPDRQAVYTAMANVFQPTALSVSEDTSPSFSGSAETDWIFQEGFSADGFVGYTWCDDAVSGDRCDQHYIRIRGNGAYTAAEVCHEAGHGAGLVHGDSTSPDTTSNGDVTTMGCMATGVGGGPGVLRQFQKDDIASTY